MEHDDLGQLDCRLVRLVARVRAVGQRGELGRAEAVVLYGAQRASDLLEQVDGAVEGRRSGGVGLEAFGCRASPATEPRRLGPQHGVPSMLKYLNK